MRPSQAGSRSERRYGLPNATAPWAVLLVLGTVAIATYYLLPEQGIGQAVVMVSMNMVGGVAAFLAAARTGGLFRAVWVFLGLGMTLSSLATAGDFGYTLIVGNTTPFPSVLDALWLLTYPCYIVVLLALARHRRGKDHLGDVLDTLILTAGGGMLIWEFLVAPAVHAEGLSASAHTVAALYPIMDLFVFAALIRLLIGAGRNDSIRLLVVSFVAVLLADALYAVEIAKGTFSIGSPIDAIWMASYLLVGVAALHPTAHSFPRARATAVNRLSRGRLLFLGGALLIGPILLATHRTDVAVVTTLSIASFLMIMTRMTLLNRRLSTTNEELAQRTGELRSTQAELIDAAHRAGMAEIAVNVLHNVGNVLNSVNVSANLVSQKVRGSKSSGLGRAVSLMREHSDDLGDFITSDVRGKQLPGYLDKLATSLAAEREGIDVELQRLTTGISHIKEIVATQQSLAGVEGVAEPLRISELMEDTMRMAGVFLGDGEVTVIRDFPDDRLLSLDRHRATVILLNLISNSMHAMKANGARPRQLSVSSVMTADPGVSITVTDNGVGIPSENVTNIFVHGFTTHTEGHGFGLHSSALAASEMGGSLTIGETGNGSGASFTLQIPLKTDVSLELPSVPA